VEKRQVYKVFSDNLKQAAVEAKRADWPSYARYVRTEIRDVSLELPAEMRQTIEAVPKQGRQLDVLKKLDAQLSGGKSLNLSRDEVSLLPSPITKAVEQVASLERLRQALTGTWHQAPNAIQLEQDLAAFAAATHEPSRVHQVRLALASRATQEGHGEVAQRLVRDLKPAVSQEVPSAHGTSKPASPLGAGAAIPESPSGASPAPKHGAREGLPPLEEEVASTAENSRRRAQEQVRDQISDCTYHLDLHVHRLLEFSQDAERQSQENDEDGNTEEMVARILKRKLTAQDRILLEGMLSKGMKRAEIAAKFRELEAAEAE
jgi:hypothetical protein